MININNNQVIAITFIRLTTEGKKRHREENIMFTNSGVNTLTSHTNIRPPALDAGSSDVIQA